MSDAKERILDAAEARLLDRGPSGLVLDAVAADAGVSKGGLLYHFPSKEKLVAGLCERMQQRFDHDFDALAADDEEPGAWARAYLAATVSPEGSAATNSAQLMAGILGALGRDSVHLEDMRKHFRTWQDRVLSDGIDPVTASIVRLAADGMWLSALLGLPSPDEELGLAITAALAELTREDGTGSPSDRAPVRGRRMPL